MFMNTKITDDTWLVTGVICTRAVLIYHYWLLRICSVQQNVSLWIRVTLEILSVQICDRNSIQQEQQEVFIWMLGKWFRTTFSGVVNVCHDSILYEINGKLSVVMNKWIQQMVVSLSVKRQFKPVTINNKSLSLHCVPLQKTARYC